MTTAQEAPVERHVESGSALVLLKANILPTDKGSHVRNACDASRETLKEMFALHRGKPLGNHSIPRREDPTIVLHDREDVAFAHSLKGNTVLVEDVLPVKDEDEAWAA